MEQNFKLQIQIYIPLLIKKKYFLQVIVFKKRSLKRPRIDFIHEYFQHKKHRALTHKLLLKSEFLIKWISIYLYTDRVQPTTSDSILLKLQDQPIKKNLVKASHKKSIQKKNTHHRFKKKKKETTR